MKITLSVLLLIILFAGSSSKASAYDDPVKVEFISTTEDTGHRTEASIGIRFTMKPGWKIYWRSPGDAGLPMTLDWSGSYNLADATVSWPVPQRFDMAGFQTAGYQDHLVLPVIARLSDRTQPLSLRLQLDYLACSDICVPKNATLTLDLPPGPGTLSPDAPLIEDFQARVPSATGPFSLDSTQIIADGDKKVLLASITSEIPLTSPDIFIEGPLGNALWGMVSDKPETVTIRADRHGASFRVPFIVPLTPDMTESLVVTIVDQNQGTETVLPYSPPPATSPQTTPLGMVAGLALLGGLILNIMPCVLPVLSLKLMSVIALSGANRRDVRQSFLATSLGIIATFLALAIFLSLLKATGASVGWGIQFQNPLFLSVMIIILGAFALNLWGVFEIPLPGFVSTLAERQGGLAPTTFRGHLFSGVLATLLATPCSAPFLGTAVGFALARGPGEILAIFFALGLGMSLPYLAVALLPQLVAVLPRPGRWMITVRKVLGFALAGAAVWLTVVLTLNLSGSSQPDSSKDGVQWRPFVQSAITDEVTAGNRVFVDITAAWCITCKVNKVTVLDHPEIRDILMAPDVIAMRGDWTTPNEDISRYMTQYQRFGVPFNIVYGPGAPQGILLPELLSRDAVTSAMEQAR